MLEILKSGGFWIIPIILSAMVATFIIIERLIYYKSIEKNEKQVLTDIKDLVKKRNFNGAKEYCRAVGTPLTAILGKAIDLRTLPISEIREGVASQNLFCVAEGDRNVNVSLDLHFTLEINDDAVEDRHYWRNETIIEEIKRVYGTVYWGMF